LAITCWIRFYLQQVFNVRTILQLNGLGLYHTPLLPSAGLPRKLAAMPAGLHSEMVEFNAAPNIKPQDGVAVVDLLEIKMHPTWSSTVQRRSLDAS
jgi:hypothetical protein